MANHVGFRSVTFLLFFACLLTEGKVSCPSSTVAVTINESDSADSVVHTLVCSGTPPVTYTLTGRPATYQHFKMVDNQLRLSKTLLNEFTYKYTLEVSVADNSCTCLPQTVTINVTKITVNLHTPVVVDFPTRITVKESEPIGTLLINCSVTDQDVGALAKKTRIGIKKPYSTPAKRWVMDADTCELYVNTLLDYENKKSYYIGILTWDLDPWAPRTSTVSIQIFVEDVNDNHPECSLYYKAKYIREDFPLNTLIYELSCTDADSGVNKAIYYRIAADNEVLVKETFEISFISGKLLLRKAIDYETAKFYEVNVEVFDGGIPSLTTSVIIAVVVSDVDENIPTT